MDFLYQTVHLFFILVPGNRLPMSFTSSKEGAVSEPKKSGYLSIDFDDATIFKLMDVQVSGSGEQDRSTRRLVGNRAITEKPYPSPRRQDIPTKPSRRSRTELYQLTLLILAVMLLHACVPKSTCPEDVISFIVRNCTSLAKLSIEYFQYRA